MAFKSIIITLAAAAHLTHGHYTFARLRHNGEWKEPYQYIRNKTEPFEEAPINANFWERGFHWPTHYIDQWDSVRCGRGNMDWAGDTETLTVQAGDEFEIVIDAASPSEWSDANWNNCPEDRGSCSASGWIWRFIHEGPVMVHLSPVPEGKEIHEYDGSGRWVKIFTLGLKWREEEERPLMWIAHNNGDPPPHITFKIPIHTPAGDYLMRMDQVWPGTRGGPFNPAEMYPSCAHIRVESESTAEFPEGIRIPQNLDLYSPGMTWSHEMRSGLLVDENWVYPGGLLWTGEELVEDKPEL